MTGAASSQCKAVVALCCTNEVHSCGLKSPNFAKSWQSLWRLCLGLWVVCPRRFGAPCPLVWPSWPEFGLKNPNFAKIWRSLLRRCLGLRAARPRRLGTPCPLVLLCVDSGTSCPVVLGTPCPLVWPPWPEYGTPCPEPSLVAPCQGFVHRTFLPVCVKGLLRRILWSPSAKFFSPDLQISARRVTVCEKS